MYYRIIDEEGMPLATGTNATSEKQVKTELIELIQPESDENYKRHSLAAILAARGWSLDKQETPFDEVD